MSRTRPVRSTLTDVAERAGVSRSTASRALTGHGYAAAAVRERVLAAAEELGYVPDANARGLKVQENPTVGLLVSDLRNPFYAEVAAGAGSLLRARGYTIVLVDDAGSDTEELAAARTFLGMRVAGVLLTPLSGGATDLLHRHQLPVVEVDRQFCRGTCDAVLVDNVRAARDVTARLLDLGHRRVTLLIDETAWTTGAGRLRGYRNALREHGRPAGEESIVSCGFEPADIRRQARTLLTSPDRPTAVFAANNLIAETLWREAGRLELAIPGDLSLVAFDDAAWMSMVTPGITTVAQPAFDLGSRAAELLLSRVDQPARPRTTLLAAGLIERGSIGPPGAP